MNAPSPAMQAVLARLADEDRNLPDPTTLPPARGRTIADLNNLRWNSALPEVARAETCLIGGLPARRILPFDDGGGRAILYIHGGGWAFCSPATHEAAARRLANACRAEVVTFDYRLAPEHPYPAGLEDCAVAWSARDPARTWSLAGDSAGANLGLALMLKLLAEGGEMPQSALLFYGVYGDDFTTRSYLEAEHGPGLTRAKMQRYWDWYVPPARRGEPLAVPLRAGDADLAALPPLYLSAAGLDPLRSDTELLVERLRTLGREDPFDLFEGVVHGFMQMGDVLPEARDAFAQAGRAFHQMGTALKPPAHLGGNT